VIKERRLNDVETRILKKDLKNLDKRSAFQKRFLIGWSILALIVGTIVYFRLDLKQEYYLLFGTVLVYILIGVWVFLENFTKSIKQRKSIDFVLTENKVKSINIVSEKYIELSEVEDEGVQYLFQISDNKIISIGGQEFYPTKKFPSNDFEIALSYGKFGELVLFEKYVNGHKIQPIKKVTGQNKWDLISNSNYPNPENYTIIDGKIEDFETLITEK